MSVVVRLPEDRQRPLDTRALAAACARAAQAASAAPDARTAVEEALELLHGAFAGDLLVALFVNDHERLWLVAQRGHNVVPDGLDLGRGIIGRAARTGQRQYAATVADDSDYVGATNGVVSELVLPIGGEAPACAALDVETLRPLPPEGADALARLADELAPHVDELRRASATDVSSLARLFVHSTTLRDAGALSELATRTLARLLALDLAQVNLGPPGRRRALSSIWSPDGEEPLSWDVLDAVGRHAERAAVLEVLDPRAVGDAAAGLPWRSVVWMPLRAGGAEIGVLVGAARRPLELGRDRLELASLLAAHLASSIDAADALTRERRAAITDPLTGVLNRRGVDERLAAELDRAGRERAPLSILVLDCDDFKRLNDAGGHELGDRVLVAIGRFLRNARRSGDAVGRLGGDEFLVVLPGSSRRAARGAAQRLQAGIRRLQGGSRSVSVSVGIATYPHDAETVSDLLRAADRAMYRAKDDGKDRAVSFAQLAGERVGGEQDYGENVVALGDRRLPPIEGLEEIGTLAGTTAALAKEPTREQMLERGCRELASLLGGAAVLASELCDGVLHEVAGMKANELATSEDYAYMLDDYPITGEVVESKQARAVSLGDADADPAEAFVLRELGMQSVLILPVTAGGGTWGIIEVYDSRPRRFTASDFGVAEFVASEVGRLLERFESAEAMERLYWETLASVTSALEAKDTYTSRHTEEVRAFAVELGRTLGLEGEELRMIELGALLHDIGKIRVPEGILNKPGPLDEAEWAVMRTHPVVGEQILQPISPLRDVLPVVRSHHERWDGRGYPDGLAAEEIPLGARIIAVCDAWRAMNEPRPYRAPLSREEALNQLRTHAGTQFDPEVVAQAVELLEATRDREPALHRPPG